MDAHEQFLVQLLAAEADLRAFIGSVVADRHVRDDLFQEVALTCWRRFAEYDATRPFGAWVRGIAAHKIQHRRREDQRFPLAIPPEAVEAVLAAFDRTAEEAPPRREALSHCVELLPEKSRSLLAARYERGVSPEKIAAETGRSLDAVYQALSRVRQILADCIQNRLKLAGGAA